MKIKSINNQYKRIYTIIIVVLLIFNSIVVNVYWNSLLFESKNTNKGKSSDTLNTDKLINSQNTLNGQNSFLNIQNSDMNMDYPYSENSFIYPIRTENEGVHDHLVNVEKYTIISDPEVIYDNLGTEIEIKNLYASLNLSNAIVITTPTLWADQIINMDKNILVNSTSFEIRNCTINFNSENETMGIYTEDSSLTFFNVVFNSENFTSLVHLNQNSVLEVSHTCLEILRIGTDSIITGFNVTSLVLFAELNSNVELYQSVISYLKSLNNAHVTLDGVKITNYCKFFDSTILISQDSQYMNALFFDYSTLNANNDSFNNLYNTSYFYSDMTLTSENFASNVLQTINVVDIKTNQTLTNVFFNNGINVEITNLNKILHSIDTIYFNDSSSVITYNSSLVFEGRISNFINITDSSKISMNYLEFCNIDIWESSCYIENTTIFSLGNTTLYQNGEIYLSNGNYVLNSTNDGTTSIVIKEAGCFFSDNNSIISSYDQYFDYYLIGEKNSFIEINSSKIFDCGFSYELNYSGIYIETESFSITNSQIISDFYGLIISQSNGSLILNNEILNGEIGIYLHKSTNININSNIIMNQHGFAGHMGLGICIDSSNKSLIMDNTLSNITGGDGGDGLALNSGESGLIGAGFYLSNSFVNHLSNNSIYGIKGGEGGIALDNGADGIEAIDVGIYLEEDSFNNKIDFSNTYEGDNFFYLYNEKNKFFENISIIGYSNPTNLGKISIINCDNITLTNITIQNFRGQNGKTAENIKYSEAPGIGTGLFMLNVTNSYLSLLNIYNIFGGTGGTSKSHSTGGAGRLGTGIYCKGSSNNFIENISISNIFGGTGGRGGYLGTTGTKGVSTGIYFSDSIKNTLTNNSIYNLSEIHAGIFLKQDSFQNTVNLNNKLENELILYFYNQSEILIVNLSLTQQCNPTNLGKVSLINCSEFEIRNLTIKGFYGINGENAFPHDFAPDGYLGTGIFLYNTSNSLFVNNTIHEVNGGKGGTGGFEYSKAGEGGIGSGIYLLESYNNTFVNNLIFNIAGGNGGSANWRDGSGTGGVGGGIYLQTSLYNIFDKNILYNISGGDPGYISATGNNGYAIFINDNSFDNTILDSNLIENDPIFFFYNQSNIFLNNYELLSSGNPTNLGKIVFINCDNVTITNTTLSQFAGLSGISGESWHGIGENGYYGSGLVLINVNNSLIINNTILNIKGGDGGSGQYLGLGGDGGFSAGIYLLESYNISILFNTILNITAGEGGINRQAGNGGDGGIGAGIFLLNSTGNFLENNILLNIKGGLSGYGGSIATSGNGGLGIGIYLENSSFNNVSQTAIKMISGGDGTNAGFRGSAGSGGSSSGIYLKNSVSNLFYENNISSLIEGKKGIGEGADGLSGNCFGFFIFSNNSYNNSIDSSNTLEKLPIVFIYKKTDIELKNLDFSSINSNPLNLGIIAIIDSYNITISNCTISNYKGVNPKTSLQGQSGYEGGIGAGIFIENSELCDIIECKITNIQGGTGGTAGFSDIGGKGGMGYGIYLYNSQYCTIENNSFYNITGGNGGDGGIWDPDGDGGDALCVYLENSFNNRIVFSSDSIQAGEGVSNGSVYYIKETNSENNMWAYETSTTVDCTEDFTVFFYNGNNTPIDTAYLFYKNNSEWFSIDVTAITSYTFSNSSFQYLASYSWYYWFNDTNGVFNSFSILNFIIVDEKAPSYSNFILSNYNPSFNESTSAFISITEPPNASGLDLVLFVYRLNQGSWTIIDVSLDLNFNFDESLLTYGQNWEFYFWFNDTAGNNASTEILSFSVSDLYHPELIDLSQTSDNISYEDFNVISISLYEQMDASGINNTILYYQLNDDTWISVNISHIYLFNFTTEIIKYGEIKWYIWFNDYAGNYNLTEINSFIVYDNISPFLIEAGQQFDYPNYDASTNVYIFLFEPLNASGIDKILFYYRVNSGTWVVCDVTLTAEFLFNSSLLFYNQIYEWYFFYNDTAGNSDSTTIHSFNVSDTYAPVIESISYEIMNISDYSIQISVNVSEPIDASGIKEVRIYYRIDDGNMKTLEIYPIGLLFFGTINNVPLGSTVSFYLQVIDYAYNQFNSSIFNTKVEDLVAPSILELAYFPEYVSYDDNMNITIRAEDDFSGISEIILHYRTNLFSWSNLSFTNRNGFYYIIIEGFNFSYSFHFYVSVFDYANNSITSDVFELIFDTDNDLMADGWEVFYGLIIGTNDANLDPDQDELLNIDEYLNKTDPHNSDTDSDLMPDGWEVEYGLNPLINDSLEDMDQDGLTNYEEMLLSTSPNNADSDGDGLTDGDEVNTYSTDPLDTDSDSDNLSDYDEVIIYLTDPNNPDSDDDGLDDYSEIMTYNTNPNNADSDDDGLDDYDEIIIYLTDPNNPDTDGDGRSDAWEINHNKNPTKANVYFKPIEIIGYFILPPSIIIPIAAILLYRRRARKKKESVKKSIKNIQSISDKLLIEYKDKFPETSVLFDLISSLDKIENYLKSQLSFLDELVLINSNKKRLSTSETSIYDEIATKATSFIIDTLQNRLVELIELIDTANLDTYRQDLITGLINNWSKKEFNPIFFSFEALTSFLSYTGECINNINSALQISLDSSTSLESTIVGLIESKTELIGEYTNQTKKIIDELTQVINNTEENNKKLDRLSKISSVYPKITIEKLKPLLNFEHGETLIVWLQAYTIDYPHKIDGEEIIFDVQLESSETAEDMASAIDDLLQQFSDWEKTGKGKKK